MAIGLKGADLARLENRKYKSHVFIWPVRSGGQRWVNVLTASRLKGHLFLSWNAAL